jgi:hypothetical protein
MRTRLHGARYSAADVFPEYRPRRLANQKIFDAAVERLSIHITARAECIEHMRNIVGRVREARQENTLIKNAPTNHFLKHQRAMGR